MNKIDRLVSLGTGHSVSALDSQDPTHSGNTIRISECLSASKADHELDSNQMQMVNTQINAFVAVGLLFAEIYGIVVHCVFAASR